MPHLGKTLVTLGLGLVVVGLILWSGFGRDWIGRLPGDIRIERGGSRFYFPVTTCILASVVLSLILWLFRR